VRHVPLALALVLLAAPARGQSAGAPEAVRPPQSFKWTQAPRWLVRLAFATTPGCADFDARSFRERMIYRVTYDPFIPLAAFKNQNPNPEPGSDVASARALLAESGMPTPAGDLAVKVMRTGAVLTATARWTDPSGEERVSSTHTQAGTGPWACFQVLEAIATRVALEFPMPKLEPLPVPTCSAAEPAPAAPAPVPAAPPVFVPWNSGFIGVGAGGDFGSAWGALAEVSLEVGLQRQQWPWGGWSASARIHWGPQQNGITPPAGQASINENAGLVAGNLSGCVHRAWPVSTYRAWPVSLAGCIVGELGAVQESSERRSHPELHQTALFAGGGVGARVRATPFTHFYVQMETDVLGIAKVAGSTDMWSNVFGRGFAGAAGRLGVGLGVWF
jgi:hypothetical protein